MNNLPKYTLLIIGLILLLLGLGACEPDEIIIYHKKPDLVVEKAPPKIGELSQVEIIQKDIQNLPKVVRKPKYEIAPPQPEVLNVKKQFKQCYPKCTGNTYCNEKTGDCEAIAKSGWTPEKEHSATFYVGVDKVGTFDPRTDEYLPWNL